MGTTDFYANVWLLMASTIMQAFKMVCQCVSEFTFVHEFLRKGAGRWVCVCVCVFDVRRNHKGNLKICLAFQLEFREDKNQMIISKDEKKSDKKKHPLMIFLKSSHKIMDRRKLP